MGRNIDAEKFKIRLIKQHEDYVKTCEARSDYVCRAIADIIYPAILDEIDQEPTTDEEIVSCGKWIGKPIAGYATVMCSVCKTKFEGNMGKWRYCPQCGTKMKKE